MVVVSPLRTASVCRSHSHHRHRMVIGVVCVLFGVFFLLCRTNAEGSTLGRSSCCGDQGTYERSMTSPRIYLHRRPRT